MDLFKNVKKSVNIFSHKNKNSESYNVGDVIFSKNNVCVHSRDNFNNSTIHHPGYLTLSYDEKNLTNQSSLSNIALWLTWVPNSALQKYLIEEDQLPEFFSIKINLYDYESRKFSTESCDSVCSDCSSVLDLNMSSNSSIISDEIVIFENNIKYDDEEKSDTERKVIGKHEKSNEQIIENGNISDSLCLLVSEKIPNNEFVADCKEIYENENRTWGEILVKNNISNLNTCDLNENTIHNDHEDSISGCPIDNNVLKMFSNANQNNWNGNRKTYELDEKKFLVAQFYQSKPCQQFSIDLRDMKSIRLFFDDSNDGSGHLVIISKENHYKVLHFHCGGLKKISQILQTLNVFILTTTNSTVTPKGSFYEHFQICQQNIDTFEFYPEEQISEITEDVWNRMLNKMGQIEDEAALRKIVFLGGIHKSLRKIIWPFLLNTYSCKSTTNERNLIMESYRLEYEDIIERRKNLPEHIKEGTFKNSVYVIKKDVVRTDRAKPFYAGRRNPNVQKMKRILLNYAVYDTSHGYTQGMSDLLSPILAEIQDEAETFWCFVGLMKRSLFVCTPTDSDMEKHLEYLRELIRILCPAFHEYLKSYTDGIDLLFCHRWLLLCFKREFPEEVVLHMWEACWSNYLTRHFHLFICLAIIILYSDEVINNCLNADEMLFYFNSLTMYMDGPTVLRKARSLLYSFRSLTEVPSTLAPLCQEYGSDIWDNRHIPLKECTELPSRVVTDQ